MVGLVNIVHYAVTDNGLNTYGYFKSRNGITSSGISFMTSLATHSK